MKNYLEYEIIKLEKRIKNAEKRILINTGMIRGFNQHISLLRKQLRQEQSNDRATARATTDNT